MLPAKLVASSGMLPGRGHRGGGWMARRVSMSTRAELLGAIRERYRAAPVPEKRRILDEFVAVAGYHRKHAIRLLGQCREARPRKPRGRRYGDLIREVLIVLWESSDRVCSKRLRPLIPVLVPALERHGKLEL